MPVSWAFKAGLRRPDGSVFFDWSVRPGIWVRFERLTVDALTMGALRSFTWVLLGHIHGSTIMSYG